ncbi:MAG: ketoacyl-ACP synthase III [Desulfobulbaceae bacterium]|uniref:Beta-ketoacyl-[acyl-carrier-protein] synthase III n=1 Tax=Candidatus Desulfatifera sulfidica TaxID=2841691 RepID=A0A8J6N7C4_9BACT|nr:ketoacyl-ACP synthase III [Candidatus Desulfatifera sulfidica]
MGSVILGTGSCLPKRVRTNDDLARIVDTSDEWIRTRTGIQTRRIGEAGDETYRLAAKAAEKALSMAGVAAEELDLIVVGTITSHMLMPSTACFVQKEIGATKAFAFDLNAACSGFLYGLDLADQYVRADASRKILVIGAETLSTRTNWEDRNTCVLFGDGAGAVVLGSGSQGRGLVGSNLRSDGRLWSLLHMHAPVSNNADLEQADNPGVHIIMEGREVFKYAVKAMETAISDLLAREGVTLDEIDLFIPHQANIRILNKLVERVGIPLEKVFINVWKYGNTSAASIPIALDEANREGRLQPGTKLLVCSFGGGFTWGATLINW